MIVQTFKLKFIDNYKYSSDNDKIFKKHSTVVKVRTSETHFRLIFLGRSFDVIYDPSRTIAIVLES